TAGCEALGAHTQSLRDDTKGAEWLGEARSRAVGNYLDNLAEERSLHGPHRVIPTVLVLAFGCLIGQSGLPQRLSHLTLSSRCRYFTVVCVRIRSQLGRACWSAGPARIQAPVVELLRRGCDEGPDCYQTACPASWCMRCLDL